MTNDWLDAIAAELRFRYFKATKWKGALLAFAASVFIIASSSELWFTSEESLFNSLPSYPTGLIVPTMLCFFLFLLYYLNWNSVYGGEWRSAAVFYGIVCTLFDVIMMLIAIVLVYLYINSIVTIDLNTLCKLLYLAVPLAIGEFTLSSVLTQELRKAKELEKRLKVSLETLDAAIEAWKESTEESLIPSRPSDTKITEYIEKKRGRGEESRDAQRTESDEDKRNPTGTKV